MTFQSEDTASGDSPARVCIRLKASSSLETSGLLPLKLSK